MIKRDHIAGCTDEDDCECRWLDETELPMPRTAHERRCSARRRVGRHRAELLKTAPHLNDSRYAALVGAYGITHILLLDANDFLHENGMVDLESGDLRYSSIETVRRLADSVVRMSVTLGLTPGSMIPGNDDRTLDAAFERMDKISKVRRHLEKSDKKRKALKGA